MKQTALDWLIEQCPRINTIVSIELIEQAKHREKEHIIDAQMHMFHYLNNNDYGLDYINKRESAMDYTLQYYNETYK